MSAESAPERRRRERRRPDEQRFWRALKGERRVAERRREHPGAAGGGDAAPTVPADPTTASVEPSGPREVPRRTAAVTPAPSDGVDPDATTAAHDTAGPVSAAEEKRREALRRLLRAAEARLDRGGRARRLVLAKGTRVVVVRGEHTGAAGVVLDADYIHSRVLLRLDGREPPSWVPFSTVGAPERTTDDP